MATPVREEFPTPPPRRVEAIALRGAHSGPFVLAFFGLHFLLGFLLRANPVLATIHAVVLFAVAIWAVLRWKTAAVACVASYAAGTDVLWRMTGAHVPWEGAKYLVIFICLGGLLRLGRSVRWDLLALLYIAALLPSVLVLIEGFHGGVKELLQPLSFNLSGPLTLFASVWYMSQLRFSRADVRAMLGSLLAPLLIVAVITLLTTTSASALTFTDESSTATSGGFGPNQVSLSLGLGALVSFLLAVDPGVRHWQRWGALALLPFFGVQSALTFSRGGLYSFALALIPAMLLWWTHKSASRPWVTLATLIVTLVTALFIVPRLNQFTGGELATRFSDTGPTHRDVIVREDLRLWLEHPVLGLGPGGALSQRRGESTIAHTEYSRLLSEHGIFGIVALAALLALCGRQLLKRQSVDERAFRTAVILWSLISMMHAGMRIAAIGFVLSWGCAQTLDQRFSTRKTLNTLSGIGGGW